MDNIVFTPAALFELLSSIKELSDYEIGVTETMDGNIQLEIGESIYEISSEVAEDVQVDGEVIEQIEEINQEAYDTLIDEDESTFYNSDEPIEGGIIKALAKTLFVGGLVRLSANALGKELGLK